METNERPKVGIGVIIIKDGKVLLGKRKEAHGAGTWGFPGGHIECNEEMEECTKREVLEETGLEVNNFRKATFTNDIFRSEGKHYITLYFLANYISGEPKGMEPENCKEWDWFEWNALPQPLFLPIENLVKQGFNPFR